MLSNKHPSGTYNIKFKLKEKIFCPNFQNRRYPYDSKYVNICSYTKKEEYEHITKYFGEQINLIIPIRIHSDAIDKNNLQQSKPKKLLLHNEKIKVNKSDESISTDSK